MWYTHLLLWRSSCVSLVKPTKIASVIFIKIFRLSNWKYVHSRFLYGLYLVMFYYFQVTRCVRCMVDKVEYYYKSILIMQIKEIIWIESSDGLSFIVTKNSLRMPLSVCCVRRRSWNGVSLLINKIHCCSLFRISNANKKPFRKLVMIQ